MTLRDRLLAALLLAAVVVAGGIVLEREVGVARRRSGPAAAGDVTGSWVCPHGGGEGWRTWISVANAAEQPTTVRVSPIGETTSPATEVNLAPRSSRLIAVETPEMASGSTVEFFGPPVAVGWVSVRPDDDGRAAEPCTRAGRRWRLAEGSTARGDTTWLVLTNASAVDAIVDVTLIAEERQIRAGGLRGIFLAPREAAAIELNSFALGEDTLSVFARATLGRVAASLVGLGSPGLRASVGSRTLSSRWFLPGGADAASGEVVVMSGGPPAPFRMRIQGLTPQPEPLDEPNVPAGRTATFVVEAIDAGIAVLGEGDAEFAAGRRHHREGVDDGSTAGAPEPAASWVVLPAVEEEGGQQLLVVQNPGAEPVTAQIDVLGADGPVPAPGGGSVTVDAGRSRVIELTPEGGEPVAVRVTASDGEVVPASIGLSSAGYSVAVGVRLESLDRFVGEVSS